MPIATMHEILKSAQKEKYAVGAFEFWSLDSAQAIVAAAEGLQMPVILQAGPAECDFAGIENLAMIARSLAEKSRIKIALHLDHGDTVEIARQAVESGFTSVMIDASAMEYSQNVEMTRQVVAIAKPAGVTVESELGRLAGTEGNVNVDQAEAFQTDPKQAEEFVRLTGIDALAVAIGSAHGFYRKAPNLNIPRLKQIAGLVEVPLVLHGGTGIGEEMLTDAIENGICKVNICSEFLAAFGKAYIHTQNAANFKYSIPGLFGPSLAAGKAVAEEKIRIFARHKCKRQA